MARKKERIATDGGAALTAGNPFAGLELAGLPQVPVAAEDRQPVALAADSNVGKAAGKGPGGAERPRRERVLLRRLKAGKGGKVVTELSGFEPARTDSVELLRQLQRRLGTGGTCKGSVIELQGDCRETVRLYLQELGYSVAG